MTAGSSTEPSIRGYRRPLEPARDRLLHDADGREWRVIELREGMNAPALVFDSDGVFRRVREYPLEWATLDDEALLRLSWRR
jgi:hypothetical protein